MTTDRLLFQSTALSKKRNALWVAVFIALFVHGVFILGVKGIDTTQHEPSPQSLDITLINAPIPMESVPKKADFLAQENQLGAGQAIKKLEVPQQVHQNKAVPEVKPVKKLVPEKTQPVKDNNLQGTQKNKVNPVSAPKSEIKTQPPVAVEPKKSSFTAESLQQQLAELGTEIRQNQPSAEQTRAKFVDTVSTHKYVAAQYLKDWESKVERTGNLNYPEIANKKDFSGTLTLEVWINMDGSIKNIRINKSSGYPELDEAAKKIVYMSAPFPALPLDLRKEIDVLGITRVWKFSDESGLVTQ